MASAVRKRKAKTGEVVSFEVSPYSARSVGRRFNYDDLIGRGGLTTYKKMRLDEQVKAVMNFKRDAIFARGWTFTFDESSKLSEEEKARRIADSNRIVNKIAGSFTDGLNCIATGRDFGYSLTEKVYGIVESPDGRSIVGLAKLLGRDPLSFVFETDSYGALTRCYQEVAGRRIEIDLSKFVHYVHNPEFDAYFGRSDLREAYKAWFWKTKMMDYWMLYGERLAGGFAAMSVSPDAGIAYNTPQWNALEAVISELSSANGVLLPPGVTLDVKNPPTSDFYEKAVEFFDLAIARSLLVPNLLGVSHAGQTGAFAQSQTQLEAFFWTLNSDKQRLESSLNEQLFQDLGDQNYGDGDYPRFQFNELSSERIRWTIETWQKLVTGNSVLATEADESYVRNALGMPARQADSKLIAEEKGAIDQKYAPKPAVPPQNQPPDNVDGKAQLTREVVQELIEKSRVDIVTAIADAMNDDPEEQDDKVPKKMATQRAASRVHFSVIADRQTAMAQRLSGAVGEQVARNVSGLLGTDEQLTETLAQPADVADCEFTSAQKTKLKATNIRALNEAWNIGSQMARNELDRAATQLNAREPDSEPVVFARLDFADLREKAAEYFESNAFRMAGNVSDAVRAVIQAELQNAVKFGKSPSETRKAIWNALLRKGLVSMTNVSGVTTDDLFAEIEAAWAVDEATAAPYLDTLARTNLFEAMNEARFAEFTDPALNGFVEGLEYSAILDDRTTEICRHLDDHKYKADSAVWDLCRPPNHYNCRSLLIPITQLDGWDGVESPPPDVQPQEGFK